jgi:hypothetical protein
MCNVINNLRKMPIHCWAFVILTVFVNALSPFLRKSYESLFFGMPIIPLTEFVLCRMPVVVLWLCVCMLAVFLGFRHGLPARGGAVVCVYIFVAITSTIYLLGVFLPFSHRIVGLN